LLAQGLTLQRTKTNLLANTGLSAVIIDFLRESTEFTDLVPPFATVTTGPPRSFAHMVCCRPSDRSGHPVSSQRS
jgi:hypothetical protein